MATGRLPDPNTAPVTAKGDLYTYSTVPAKLAVGSNGETLLADSSTSTGLRWQGNFAAGKNKILNGDFQIWQRGTSGFSLGGAYNADRFIFYADGAGATQAITQQTFTAGTAPLSGYEAQYFWRYACTVAGSGATERTFYQRIEDVRTFAGQTVTFSFFAKADASRTLTLSLTQDFGSGGSSRVITSLTSQSVTTSWARYSASVTLPSISGKTIGTSSYLQLNIGFPINVTETIDIWGVQLEAGSVATPFTTATGTLQGELAACQRYYQRVTPSQNTSPIALGYAYNTTVATITFPLKTTMRVAPTSVEQNAASVCSLWDQVNPSINTTAVALNTVGPDNVTINCTVASGLTAFRPYVVFAGTSGYLAVSAEL